MFHVEHIVREKPNHLKIQDIQGASPPETPQR